MPLMKGYTLATKKDFVGAYDAYDLDSQMKKKTTGEIM